MLAIGAGLVACAPVHAPPPDAPLEFSRDTVRAWHKHRREYVPRFFLVSQDGQNSLSVFSRGLDCRLSEPYGKWQKICENRTGQTCHRYARLGSPRWKITIAPKPDEGKEEATNDIAQPAKRPVHLTREAICFPSQLLFHPDHSRFYRHLLD